MSGPTLIPHAPHHPGYDAWGCPLRYVVHARRYGTSSDGYGCNATGGHCLPNDEVCGRLQKELTP